MKFMTIILGECSEEHAEVAAGIATSTVAQMKKCGLSIHQAKHVPLSDENEMHGPIRVAIGEIEDEDQEDQEDEEKTVVPD